MARTEMQTALDAVEAGGFAPGPELERAHAICQAHEGDPRFDWLHALIHRIEGDAANAGYWYGRAGRARHDGTIEQEWHAIGATVAGD